MNLTIKFGSAVGHGYPGVLCIDSGHNVVFADIEWNTNSDHAMPAVFLAGDSEQRLYAPDKYPVTVHSDEDFVCRLLSVDAPMFSAVASGNTVLVTELELSLASEVGLLSFNCQLVKDDRHVTLSNLTFSELLAVRYNQTALEAQLDTADGIYFGRDKDDTGRYYSLSKHNKQRSIPVMRNGLDLEFGDGLTAFAITEAQLTHLSVTLNVMRDTQHNKD